ncbi:MAG: hypothetical protein JNL10_02365 [Verrucomicrobiales bacterium]|nr:hypothetical protein [Verrucomicrobiales bacterium]
MDPNARLRQEHREPTVSKAAQDHRTQAAPLEFATPEEMIRHDRERTEVPEAVGERLAHEVGAEPAPTGRPWWRRWLG